MFQQLIELAAKRKVEDIAHMRKVCVCSEAAAAFYLSICKWDMTDAIDCYKADEWIDNDRGE